jgi:hypothetical protein|tara:strand:- start:814 stop:1164 length:351 start_codon:yes stop_codon:yes gene_type:complete
MAYMSQQKKAALAPAIKAVLKEFNMKGSIAVNNHSTLVVNIKSGAINFGEDYIQVNPYWIDEHYKGVAKKFFNKLLAAMKGTMWYDNSDAQVDYFDTAYYTEINVGGWNTPYEVAK